MKGVVAGYGWTLPSHAHRRWRPGREQTFLMPPPMRLRFCARWRRGQTEVHPHSHPPPPPIHHST